MLVSLSGILPFFPPYNIAFSQDHGKYILGPQLLPLPNETDNTIYSPWLQESESNCENSDFSLGDWTNWEGCYGYYTNPCQFSGFKTTPPHPLHKIIAGPGWRDWNTCDTLDNVFPGESFVAKLGDSIYSSATTKAAILKYQVDVSSNSYLFIYRYAIVLQTGGHNPPDKQPDFQVMITDTNNNVLDSTCGYYYITAQVSGPPVMAGIDAPGQQMELSTGKTGQQLAWILLPIWGKPFMLFLKCDPAVITHISGMRIFLPFAISFRYRHLYVKDRIALP